MRSLALDLAAASQLKSDDIDRFVVAILDATRRSNFSLSRTMFAVFAVVRQTTGTTCCCSDSFEYPERKWLLPYGLIYPAAVGAT